jgi:phosphonate transport system substrate-binding protein
MTAEHGFGIVPAQELERAGRGVFRETCDAIEEATGVKLRPTVMASYTELATSLEEGKIGLAWLPPIPTLELEARRLATILAIPARHGATTYQSALIVRRGGPRTIGELRGRRAVWVERDSAAGYIVPRMVLASQGIDVRRFFSRESFVHSHSAVIDAVVNGDADVGATYCHVAEKRVVRAAWLEESGRALRPIDVLATSGPIPNDAMVASSSIAASARSALTRWLLDPTPRARDLLRRLLGAGEFRVPDPRHYDPLRHMLRAAHARGQDAMPSPSRTGIRSARRVT